MGEVQRGSIALSAQFETEDFGERNGRITMPYATLVYFSQLRGR